MLEEYLNDNNTLLVGIFKKNNFNPLEDPIKSIQRIYEFAILDGSLKHVQYIHERFFMDILTLTSYQKVLAKIEKNESSEKTQNRIAVSNFLLKHSWMYQQIVKSHIETTHEYCLKEDSWIELDVLSGMFLNNNYFAFMMYLEIIKNIMPSFDLTESLSTIKALSKNRDNNTPYVAALENFSRTLQ